MTRKRISVLAGVAVIAAAGIGTGVAIAVSSSPGQLGAALRLSQPCRGLGRPATPGTGP